jgi:hypothetical protein
MQYMKTAVPLVWVWANSDCKGRTGSLDSALDVLRAKGSYSLSRVESCGRFYGTGTELHTSDTWKLRILRFVLGPALAASPSRYLHSFANSCVLNRHNASKYASLAVWVLREKIIVDNFVHHGGKSLVSSRSSPSPESPFAETVSS